VRSPRRWLLAGVGVVAVALGAIGVVVPGMPTTVFLIVASYCFARSCPWLEERLLRVPVFAPYMALIDDGQPMPRRARIVALGAMWLSVSLSLAWLYAAGRLSLALALIIVGIAATGTAVLMRYRREARTVGAGERPAGERPYSS
jgi:hypothetical protein